MNFYSRVGAAFTKTCRSTPFLRPYATDGQRLYGVSPGYAPAIPYSGDYPPSPPTVPLSLPINDEEAYSINLAHWTNGDDPQKGDSRQFFWNAFLHSHTVTIIEEVEQLGSGQRIFRHEFRKAHQFISSALSEELTDAEFKIVLELITSCCSGSPYPLAEILVRHDRPKSFFRQYLICYALGEISSSPHASVSNFLDAHSRSRSWPVRLEATLARFKIFVKSEGIFRLNNIKQTRVSYEDFVDVLTKPMSETEKIVCLLAFASILSGPGISSLSAPFKRNYTELQSLIENLCISFIKNDNEESQTDILKQLIQTNDYIGVCLLIAKKINKIDQLPLRNALINACCNASIIRAGHDQASRHLAICFLLKEDHHMAFEIAEELAYRNPEWIDIQVLAAEILGAIQGAEEDSLQMIAKIRETYKLDIEFESRLNVTEREIKNRKA